jgi:hypothetical protein
MATTRKISGKPVYMTESSDKDRSNAFQKQSFPNRFVMCMEPIRFALTRPLRGLRNVIGKEDRAQKY